jgi:hypothetical protein
MTKAAALAPDFEDQSFSAPASDRPPFAQIINPRFTKKGIAPYGFALTKKNAEACSFSPPAGWELVEHEFASGDKEQVFMTLTPRMVIIAKTPLYLKLRETGEFLGEMREIPDYWDNKHLYKTISYSWCYVLDENSKPCNAVPLLISLGGASGASFNASWLQYQTKSVSRSGFCFDMEKAYAQSRKQDYKPMGELFHAHCIYEPTFDADERGTKPNTALVAIVASYKPANIGSLVVNGSELSEQIKVARESVKDWQPRKKAKPEVVEDDGYSPKGSGITQHSSDYPLSSYGTDDEFGYPPY